MTKMTNMKRSILAASILWILCGMGGAVFADEISGTTFDEVIVSADRDVLPGGFLNKEVGTGLLGGRNVMDTPFTQYSITQKGIEDFGNPNMPAISALMNVPSVKGGATMTHNDFSIRGHYLQGASFFLNGIPGLYSQMNAPTNMISSIELISGPNMLSGTQMEKNSVAGSVNFVSKKAGDIPITRYTQMFTGRGNFGEYIDVGRRFGKNNEWGIRINGEIQNGEMSLENSDLKAKGIFLNIDHKNEESSSNLLAGYREQKVLRGMRWFKFDSKMTNIPKVPNAKTNVSFDQMIKEEESWILALNHKQKINDHAEWFVNVGMLNSDLKRNVSPQGSAYTINNVNGDYTFKTYNGRTPNSYRYYQAGLDFKGDTGSVKHDIVLAADYITQKSYTNTSFNQTGPSFSGNVYQGAPIMQSQSFPVIDKKLSADSKLWGISLVDDMQYKKLHVITGIHKHSAEIKSYSKTGKMTKEVKADAVSPVYGILYQPNRALTLYASHTEGFSKGDVIGSAYENQGDILNPSKSKENEVGIKWLHGKFLTTASYFDIKEAQNIKVDENGKLYMRQDGEVEYEGAELYTTGNISNKWNVFAGVMYVDAVRNKTDNGRLDGYRLNGSSKWNGVVGFEYLPSVNTSIFGRMLYNGTAVVNDEKLTLPSYTTFDMGITHQLTIHDVKTKIAFTCYNLTNKNYWMTRSGGNEVLLSLPRTWLLSAQFDF